MPTLAWETVTGWRTVGDRFSRQLWRLESDALCADARHRTGLEYFGEPAIDPALTVLLNSLENEADLHLLGRATCCVPTYEAFLHSVDLAPVYTWQKRFLQYLQLGCPEQRWVLKSPNHVYCLDKLLVVFCDALVIRTHRDPIDVIKSQLRLTQVLEGLFARRCEYNQLAKREVRAIAEMSDQILRFHDQHPLDSERFVDVTYRELVTDTLAIVRRVYDRLGARLTPAAAARMQRFALTRSRYRRRKLNATPALDCGAEVTRFEAYCSRFGVSLQRTN